MSAEHDRQRDHVGNTDFLTPQQRLDAIADILATIALRAIREDDENQQTKI